MLLCALCLIAWSAAATAARADSCAGSAGAPCPYSSVTILGQRAEGVLHFPEAVALDGQGNVYVADQLGYVVQKFTLTGTFETQWGSYGAGPGQFGPIAGLATDAEGNVYVVDSEHNRVEKFSSSGAFIASWGHSGSALGDFHFYSSQNPSEPPGGAIAIAGAYVYVVDSGNDRVERFNLEGGEPMQWGSKGSGAGQFNYPRAIAASATEVLVSDADNHRIEKFGPNGELEAVAGSAGDGPGQFGYPYGVSLDGAGDVYVADDSNDRVVKLNPELQFIAAWGGQGSKPGQLYFPRALASDAGGETYVADTANDRIEVFDTNGNYLRTMGLSGRGSDTMTAPDGLAGDPTGRLLVSDADGGRIMLFGPSPQGGAEVPLGAYEAAGVAGRRVSGPAGIGVDRRGSIYVAEPGQERIVRLWGEGSFLSELGGPAGVGSAGLSAPGDVAVDPGSGTIYVADTDHNRILVYPAEGTPLLAPAPVLAAWGANQGNGTAGSGLGQFDHPDAVAVADGGDVYVADTGNDRIVQLSPLGTVLGEWGGKGSAPGRFNAPTGIAVDGAGNVYVVDSANSRVEVFSASGQFLDEWGARGIGPGEFSQPSAITVDCNGYVYVADTDNNRVQRFQPVDPQPVPGGCLAASAWPPPLDVPPVLRVSLVRQSGVLGQRAVALRVSCERACRVRITGTLATRARHAAVVKLIAATRSLPASVTGHVRLRLRASTVAKLSGALRRKRGLTVHLKILAVGPTGRETTLIRSYPLTR